MLAVPLSGFLGSILGRGIVFFGLPLPPLLGRDRELSRFFNETRELLIWSLAALAAGHIAIALWHAIVRRDGTLRRILPGRRWRCCPLNPTRSECHNGGFSRSRMRVLVVKTSSLGDVVHCLPAVSDLARARLDAEIEWVVEEGFAAIPRLHPRITRVLPVAIRRWRRALGRHDTWREITAFDRALRARRYDAVLDAQGLVKSALITARARGPGLGYAPRSAREPASALFYRRRFAVSRALHAVERNRRLAGRAFGYEPAGPPDYGLRAPAGALPWVPDGPYAVLLHATSRADKLWPEDDWQALAARLHGAGLGCVLPWGSEAERERAGRLARAMPGAVAAPRLDLTEAAQLLAGARVAIGVDTGLVHLAAALGAPTVALYTATDPGLTGVHAAGPHANLGGRGRAPDAAAVWRAVSALAVL